MSRRTLYHSPFSPFSRSVLLLCRYLNIDLEVKELNLLEEEQMSPEFLKINPQHCVPTLEENGFVLWESRAILNYLADTNGQHLVPTSSKKKAIVNQRLYSEMDGIARKYADIFVRRINRHKNSESSNFFRFCLPDSTL
jgi:glutathione S-transferase